MIKQICVGLFGLILLSGCNCNGTGLKQRLSESDIKRGYDSVNVYYIDRIEAYTGCDARSFMRKRIYNDNVITVKNALYLDSLYKGVTSALHEDLILYREADPGIVIIAHSRDRIDTISLDRGPFLVEINGSSYSRGDLFWWGVDRIVEQDSTWAMCNKKELDIVRTAVDVYIPRESALRSSPDIAKYRIDSAKVFYSRELNVDRFMSLDTRIFLRKQLYDDAITILEPVHLDKLYHDMRRCLKQERWEDPYLDAFIVVVTTSQDKADTLAFSSNPYAVEIDGFVYPDNELFWWAVDRISELDDSWTIINKDWLYMIR